MTTLPMIGFIGLGEMGGPMALNLMKAGYPLTGFDLDEERRIAITSAGARAGQSVADVVASCDVVATSLPSSSSFVTVVEAEILPNVRAG